MNGERYFLDAFFVIALLNRRDRYHTNAQTWLPRLHTAKEVFTTEAVLLEIGDGLSAVDRVAAIRFIDWLRRAKNVRIVKLDTELLDRGLRLYSSRQDKTWGLTDSISFVVMREHGLSDAVTADDHFTQAGFMAVMTE